MRSSFANGAATTAAARNNATCVNVTSVMGGSVWASLGGAIRAGKRCRGGGYKANVGAVEVVNLGARCEKGAAAHDRRSIAAPLGIEAPDDALTEAQGGRGARERRAQLCDQRFPAAVPSNCMAATPIIWWSLRRPDGLPGAAPHR